jgi:pimeloyl-ACP methyl ester carboxylesterase
LDQLPADPLLAPPTVKEQGSMPLINNSRGSLLNAGLATIKSRPYASAALAVAVTLTASAVVNTQLAWKAERDNPPRGKFLEIGGVRLHYIERGAGDALVLLHGNGSMIQDFDSSGLIDLAAKTHRVITFDRPGFGHSERPRGTVWTAAAQAELIYLALERLGISRSTVLGHSWGASVAIAFALRYPSAVTRLVLASGYYYPTLRADAALMSIPAAPLIGDVLSFSISPIASRLMWPGLTRKIFEPASAPKKFAAFPRELAVRPSQIRASAGDAALMIPNAIEFRNQYKTLEMPVGIIAGEGDRIIDIDQQSARLHQDIPHSKFYRIPAAGHMVHQTAPHALMAAINDFERPPEHARTGSQT